MKKVYEIQKHLLDRPPSSINLGLPTGNIFFTIKLSYRYSKNQKLLKSKFQTTFEVNDSFSGKIVPENIHMHLLSTLLPTLKLSSGDFLINYSTLTVSVLEGLVYKVLVPVHNDILHFKNSPLGSTEPNIKGPTDSYNLKLDYFITPEGVNNGILKEERSSQILKNFKNISAFEPAELLFSQFGTLNRIQKLNLEISNNMDAFKKVLVCPNFDTNNDSVLMLPKVIKNGKIFTISACQANLIKEGGN